MGRIDKIIGESAFEKIRDRIYEIVSDELTQQAAITYDDDFLDADVFLERWVPFQHAEMPAVNITFASGDLDPQGMENKNTSHREYRYNIDFYGVAPSTQGERGDYIAARKVQRLMAVVDAILRDKRYMTLQFTAPFVMNTKVESLRIGNPENTMDAANVVLGRLSFVVRVPENVQDIEPRDLPGYTTQVLINESASGYVFSGDNVDPIDPTCPPVAVLINDTEIADVTPGTSLNIDVINTLGLPVGEWNYYTEKWIVPAQVPQPLDINFNDVLTASNPKGGETFDVRVQDTGGNPTGTVIGETDAELTIEVDPAGDVYYNRPYLNYVISYNDYDEAYRRINGGNDYNDAIPDSGLIQQVQPDYVNGRFDYLKYFNKWGHKFRFTGENGGYLDEADGNYYDVNGVLSNQSTEFPTVTVDGAGRILIYDHLLGCVWFSTRNLQGRNYVDNLNAAAISLELGFNWFIASIDEYLTLRYVNEHDCRRLSKREFNYFTSQSHTCTQAFLYSGSNPVYFSSPLGGGLALTNLSQTGYSNDWCAFFENGTIPQP